MYTKKLEDLKNQRVASNERLKKTKAFLEFKELSIAYNKLLEESREAEKQKQTAVPVEALIKKPIEVPSKDFKKTKIKKGL